MYDDYIVRRVTLGDIIVKLFSSKYSSAKEFADDVATCFNNTLAYWEGDENGVDYVRDGAPGFARGCACVVGRRL